MALTQEEKDKIKLTVMEAIEAYKEKTELVINEKIIIHEKTCNTKITLDRIKWLLIGSFGSGLVGGGTLGAWIVSILKEGVQTSWLQQVIRHFCC